MSMTLKFIALPTEAVRQLQNGAPDANGRTPERAVSDGGGNPCRHCLCEIPAGEEMLVLAYRPFPDLQPYAEVGPLFLCAAQCERHPESAELPDMFQAWEKILVRGYGADNRIVYGSGQVISMTAVPDVAASLLERDEITFVHMRSASNNCYQARIESV